MALAFSVPGIDIRDTQNCFYSITDSFNRPIPEVMYALIGQRYPQWLVGLQTNKRVICSLKMGVGMQIYWWNILSSPGYNRLANQLDSFYSRGL